MEKKSLLILGAIVVIVVLVFAISQLTGMSVKGHGECSDSDNGRDYTVKGTAKFSERDTVYTDYCKTKAKLVEYYCTIEKTRIWSEKVSCYNGCVDGVCLPV